MTQTMNPQGPQAEEPHAKQPRTKLARGSKPSMLNLLLRDKVATVAAVVLAVVALTAIFGPPLMGELATKQDLMFMNKPPFDPAQRWRLTLDKRSAKALKTIVKDAK